MRPDRDRCVWDIGRSSELIEAIRGAQRILGRPAPGSVRLVQPPGAFSMASKAFQAKDLIHFPGECDAL